MYNWCILNATALNAHNVRHIGMLQHTTTLKRARVLWGVASCSNQISHAIKPFIMYAPVQFV